MYDVLDVCRFIINYCDDQDYAISNLKLQKILYFIQAWFLCRSETRKACFKEEIEAWDFGPVVPEAYHEYKQFGSTNLPRVTFYIQRDEDDFWESKVVPFNDDVITLGDKDIIRKLVDKFARYSTTTLVNVTHGQSPWIDAYEPGKNNVITNEAIRSYFNG